MVRVTSPSARAPRPVSYSAAAVAVLGSCRGPQEHRPQRKRACVVVR